MPALSKKKSVLILGLLLIIIVAVGASRGPKKEPVDEVNISFTESELDELGKFIESQEFDDLGGLSVDELLDLEDKNTSVELIELELDNLGKLLEGLEFEDLGGLAED